MSSYFSHVSHLLNFDTDDMVSFDTKYFFPSVTYTTIIFGFFSFDKNFLLQRRSLFLAIYGSVDMHMLSRSLVY